SPFAPHLWEAITHKFAGGSAPHADSRNIIVVGSSLYEVDDGGVFRLANVGTPSQVWDSLNTNLRTAEVFRVAYDPLNGVINAGLQDNGAAQQRLKDDDTDGSISEAERESWESTHTGDGTTQVAVMVDSNNVFRYAMNLTQKNLRRSRYNG